MVGGLAALGAGGGGFQGSFDSAYNATQEQEGDKALWKGLQVLSQMGGGAPPPMMPPGGGMPPMGPQGPGMGGPPMGGGMPPQGQPPMGAPPGGPPMPSVGAPSMNGAPGGGMPPPGGPPGSPGIPPVIAQQMAAQQQQGGGFQVPGQGPLDWRQVIQAVQKGNPGAPPNVLMAAVHRAIPLMTADSRQQFMQFREQIQMMLASERAAHNVVTEGQGQQKINLAAEKETKKTTEAQEIGDAIIRGEQPPVTTGLWRVGPDVKAYLASKGFDQAKAISEWNGAQAAVRGWNSQRMIQYRGLAQSVTSTIDEVRSLSDQLQLNGLTSWNKIRTLALTKGASNTAAGQQAIAYVTAVNTLKSEFAQLENGGYAPTEEVWKLAKQQINSDYGVKGMDASLDEIQKLINFRTKAIEEVTGAGGQNRYQGGGQPSETPKQKPGKTQFQERFEGIPEGWSVQEH